MATEIKRHTHAIRKKILDDDNYSMPLQLLLENLPNGTDLLLLSPFPPTAKRRLFHYLAYLLIRRNSADSLVGISLPAVNLVLDYHRGRYLNDIQIMEKSPNPRYLRDAIHSEIVSAKSAHSLKTLHEQDKDSIHYNRDQWLHLYMYSVITELKDISNFSRTYQRLLAEKEEIYPINDRVLAIQVLDFCLSVIGHDLSSEQQFSSSPFYQSIHLEEMP